MKRYLIPLGVVASLAALVLYARPASAALPAPIDINGTYLNEGDLISASTYGDPDIFIIKYKAHFDQDYNPGDGGDRHGYKRLFLNPAIFNMYGHLGGFSRVHKVTPAVRDAFTTSGLFRNCETGDQRIWATEVTGEDDGILHHVQMTGEQAANEDPFFFDKVFCINTREDNFYARSIHPYTRLADVPRYERRACRPRPACLDSEPRCLMAEPAEGWCPTTTPARPSITYLDPTSGPIGTAVKLVATSLAEKNTVRFGSGVFVNLQSYPDDFGTRWLQFTIPSVLPCDQPCPADRNVYQQQYAVTVQAQTDGSVASSPAYFTVTAQASSGPCYVGGCSSQLCTDRPDAVSTCEYRQEYACYRHARCERQSNGSCGWSATTTFSQCWAAGGAGY